MPSQLDQGPLYLGFDLSTQQLKAIVITSSLKVLYEAKADFDADLSKYGIKKGVHVNEAEREVYAPVAMWLEAVDLVLQRLKEKGTPFQRVKGISGAGQQHGSVYWSKAGETILGDLDPKDTLINQLEKKAFAHPNSPNWQDASTQKECDAFDAALGSPEKLAQVTGSKAHHRFTGPQIMRFHKKYPDVYRATSRITLVSSFLASVFLGKIAVFDISDVCGMNLWDINAGAWCEPLLTLAAGEDGLDSLKQKLGEVREDGGGSLGNISSYFVSRYNFAPNCGIAPFTGDNPATILALPLRPLDAIVSLGTSTTFLMSTPKYFPDPAYHFFNHPTTAGLYMFMLCYKNGGLAREKVRDSLPKPTSSDSWSTFNEAALSTPPLGQKSPSDPAKLGLYFPLPEIVPNVRAGTWRYTCASDGSDLQVSEKKWGTETEARIIVESQMLSLRLRSHNLTHKPSPGLPPQPRRIYLVGGGSLNPAIARIIGDVLGGTEGVWKLDVGGNACALGGAYKAVWAMERNEGESFEDLIGERWKESEAVEKVDEGYRKDAFERYGNVLKAFEQMEGDVLAGEERNL
ncbi:putative D-xylulose kinase A [Lachnellula hyalina]|uniref:Xylulose kinase n=1 Tax=Lachnellula hyalina TaxID=1316788 RepID=A0A8H8TUI1_9HELO|nr:putative D-xylulose kinase A [Lachnellula hyalina]TVY22824.1 putative D-xylulose kinase A [Lachnellula hyalina]